MLPNLQQIVPKCDLQNRKRWVELEQLSLDGARDSLSEVEGYTNLLKSVRPRDASSGFQRSPTFAIRSRTLSSRKSSIRTPRATSDHSSGVDTVASGVGRTE